MPLEPQTKEIPFRFGLDRTEDEEGNPNGALELVNFDFDEDGVLLRRGGFIRSEELGHDFSKYLPDAVAATRGPPRLLLQDAKTPVVIADNLSARIVQSITTLSPGARIQHVSAAYQPAFGCVCIATACSGETVADNSGSIYYQDTGTFQVFVHVVDVTNGAIYFTHRFDGTSVVRVVTSNVYLTGDPAWVLVHLPGASLHFSTITQAPTGSRDFVLKTTTTPMTTAVSTAAIIRPVDAVSLGDTVEVTWVEGGAAPFTWKKATVQAEPVSGVQVLSSPSTLTPTPAYAEVWVWAIDGSTPIYGYMSAAAPTVGLHLVYLGIDHTVGTTNWIAPHFTLALASGGTYVALWNNLDIPGTAEWGIGDIKYQPLFISASVSNAGALMTYSGMQIGTDAANVNGKLRVGIYATSAPDTQFANLTLAYYDEALDVLLTEGQLAFDEYGMWRGPLDDIFEANAGYPPPLLPVGAGGMCPVPVAMETGGSANERISRAVRRIRLVYFDGTSPFFYSAHLQNTHFLTGSYLAASDETRVFPAAFLVPPAIVPQTFGAAANVWGYVALFEYVDFHGNIQVSPPSTTFIYKSASTNPTPTLQIQVPDPTRDEDQVTQFNVAALRVKIYRTQKNGSTFNLIFATHVLDTSVPGLITFTDNLSDTDIAEGETLYTTGGVLASELAPPIKHITAHRNRLVGVRSDIPETIMFTTETFEPQYPRWNSVLSFRVDNQGGAPLAVASMFDKLVILQHEQICVVTGEGPDALGNGAFSLPETVVRGVGVEPHQVGSVVETPLGVMFAHRTGIHLMTPSLEIVPIGRALGGKRFGEGNTIHRARFLPSLSQVWFLASFMIYVYDLRAQRWTTFTGPWGTLDDVAEIDGIVYAICAGSTTTSGKYTLYRLSFDDRRDQDPADDDENLIGFTQTVGLPWLRQDRAQELRLWKVYVSGSQGEGWADPQAAITVEAYSQDERRNKQSTVADNAYTWSADTILAEPDNFLLRGRVVSQRGRALRCRLTVTPAATYTGGALYRLSALTYDFGMLRGRGKTRARPTAA
jgi:hypothetical protein